MQYIQHVLQEELVRSIQKKVEKLKEEKSELQKETDEIDEVGQKVSIFYSFFIICICCLSDTIAHKSWYFFEKNIHTFY